MRICAVCQSRNPLRDRSQRWYAVVLVSAGLTALFLLLFFGLVIAPAVFAKAERAERARRVLAELVTWMPLFLAIVRRAAPTGATRAGSTVSPVADGSLHVLVGAIVGTVQAGRSPAAPLLAAAA